MRKRGCGSSWQSYAISFFPQSHSYYSYECATISIQAAKIKKKAIEKWWKIIKSLFAFLQLIFDEHSNRFVVSNSVVSAVSMQLHFFDEKSSAKCILIVWVKYNLRLVRSKNSNLGSEKWELVEKLYFFLKTPFSLNFHWKNSKQLDSIC